LETNKYKGLVRDRPHVSVFAGRKGSGKTQLLIKLLKDAEGWKGVYQKIIIVSPTFKFQKAWKCLAPDGITVYTQLTDELMEKLLQTSPSINTLIIFDDNGEDVKRVNTQAMNKLISNSRHLNLSIVFLLQKLSQAPTIVRSNTDTFVCFSATSTRETDLLWAEIGVLSKKDFYNMFRDATQEQYSCFVASMEKGKLKFYKNFDSEYH
jgi:hypothetical protein